jgi:hypothetical protein
MTGINSSLFDDEKLFRKSVVRTYGGFYEWSLSMSPFDRIISDSTYPIATTDPNIEMPLANFYYANNSLYFLGSNELLNLELEIYDLTDNPDTLPDADALLISNKTSVKIVVKGLGIPANFSRTIKLLPTIHPYLVSRDLGYGDVSYGAEYGEQPVKVEDLPDHSTYTIERDNLGISDIPDHNAWWNRLHGDIIDMAFYVEGI